MNFGEFKIEFNKLGNNIKTSVIDKFDKKLINNKVDVSFLKPLVKEHQEPCCYGRSLVNIILGYV